MISLKETKYPVKGLSVGWYLIRSSADYSYLW